jgi:hypothetical protein
MSSFDIHADVIAPCAPAELFPFVDDLAAYPPWMRLVHAVTALPPDADGRPAWQVELRARVGPLARSKRLRMVRTVHRPDAEVVFERAEVDGRAHSAWVLTATLAATDPGTRLDVGLHYGGGLWTGGVLERVLRDEIERGRRRLLELVAAR